MGLRCAAGMWEFPLRTPFTTYTRLLSVAWAVNRVRLLERCQAIAP